MGDACTLIVAVLCIAGIIAAVTSLVIASLRNATRLDAVTTCTNMMHVDESRISEYKMRGEAFSNTWVLQDPDGEEDMLRFEKGVLFDDSYDVIYSQDGLPDAEVRTSAFDFFPEFSSQFKCVLSHSAFDFEVNFGHGDPDAELIIGDPRNGRSNVYVGRQDKYDKDPQHVRQYKLSFTGVSYGDRNYLNGLSVTVLKLILPAVDTFRVCIGTHDPAQSRTKAQELDYSVAGAVTALAFSSVLDKEASQRATQKRIDVND